MILHIWHVIKASVYGGGRSRVMSNGSLEADSFCCLIDEGVRCQNLAITATWSKRANKNVGAKLNLITDPVVSGSSGLACVLLKTATAGKYIRFVPTRRSVISTSASITTVWCIR